MSDATTTSRRPQPAAAIEIRPVESFVARGADRAASNAAAIEAPFAEAALSIDRTPPKMDHDSLLQAGRILDHLRANSANLTAASKT